VALQVVKHGQLVIQLPDDGNNNLICCS